MRPVVHARSRHGWLPLAVAALVLSTMPVAAQSTPSPLLRCEGTQSPTYHHALVVARGTDALCQVDGSDPDVPITWKLQVYRLPGNEELPEVSGQVPAGQTEFTIPVADEDLWFEVIAFQGDEDTPSVRTRLRGTTTSPPRIGMIECSPDPAVGQTTWVECVIGGLAPNTMFYSNFDYLTAEGDRYSITAGDALVFSDRTGTVRFSDLVCCLEDPLGYIATAYDDDLEAIYVGGFVPEAPTPAPPGVTPSPAPSPSQEAPAPVEVARPARIDTGGGGTAVP